MKEEGIVTDQLRYQVPITSPHWFNLHETQFCLSREAARVSMAAFCAMCLIERSDGA